MLMHMPISSQALILIIYPNKTQERRDNVITKRKQGWFVKLSNGKWIQFNTEKRGEWLAKKLAEESEAQDCKIINYIENKIEYSILYIYSQKYGLKEILIDNDSVDIIKDTHWCLVDKGHDLYVSCGTNHTYLHRILLNITDPNVIVDHINRNPLDNRLENLRLTDRHGNRLNTSLRECNTSGIKGVRYDSIKDAWVAEIKDLNHKKHSISRSCKKYGYEQAKQMCIDFRKEKEIEYGYMNGIEEGSETIESDSENRSK